MRGGLFIPTDHPLEESITASAPTRSSLIDLPPLASRPMPDDVRGALVHDISATPAESFRIRWMAADHPDRVPPGKILLSWKPAADGHMDVTAHLGLPGTEVTLATWPGLTGDWTSTVHPTVYEVTGLHTALTLATIVLEMLAD